MAYLDLTIWGGDVRKKDLARKVVEFAINELKLNRMNLEIKLRLRKLKDADGWCIWEDNNLRPREFTIDCRINQRKDDFITTILHEMVHVKQYARGEMRELFKNEHRILWKGKNYINTEYMKQPWEKEAYKLQETLLIKYYKMEGK